MVSYGAILALAVQQGVVGKTRRPIPAPGRSGTVRHSPASGAAPRTTAGKARQGRNATANGANGVCRLAPAIGPAIPFRPVCPLLKTASYPTVPVASGGVPWGDRYGLNKKCPSVCWLEIAPAVAGRPGTFVV